MVTIRLSGLVTENHELIAAVPANVPPGDIEFVLEVPETIQQLNEVRENVRAKLRAAGALSEIWTSEIQDLPVAEQELIELGTLSPDAPSVSEMIIEMRGNQ
jgi:hypothetical protein